MSTLTAWAAAPSPVAPRSVASVASATSNFWSGEDNGQDAVYDEIRIWDQEPHALRDPPSHEHRVQRQRLAPRPHRLHKGDVISIDGKPYLHDCVGAHNAPITNPDTKTYEEINSDKTWNTEVKGTISINNTRITVLPR